VEVERAAVKRALVLVGFVAVGQAGDHQIGVVAGLRVVLAEASGSLDARPDPVVEHGLLPGSPRRRGTTRHGLTSVDRYG
jgi:hypothetical protein